MTRYLTYIFLVPNKSTKVLRWGKNRIFDGLLCHLIHSNNTNPNMVCSSPHDSIHSSVCSGDSGSSLVCMQDSKPVVAGVASQATVKQCGTRNSLAIFTKVMPYLSWIKQCMVRFVRFFSITLLCLVF